MALSQWIEKTEAIFEICACLEGSKVKFAACIFYRESSDLVEWPCQVTNSGSGKFYGLGESKANVNARVLSKGRSTKARAGTLGPYYGRLGHHNLYQ